MTNSTRIVRMTLLWGGCEKITRQLGNIENNTMFFKKKIYVSKFNFSLWKYVVWFLVWSTKKGKKKPREIMVSKAGTMWQFGGISNRYTSWQIYGRYILSTWPLSSSHDAHSPVLATGIDQFMAQWQRTPATSFRLLHMRNGW
jgi:hypothetical protein